MSAQIRDDDEGPIDRENVISNLIMLRLEEFLERPNNEATRASAKASISQSLRTMAMVFKIPQGIPLVEVTSGEGTELKMRLLDPATKEPMTVGEWLQWTRSKN